MVLGLNHFSTDIFVTAFSGVYLGKIIFGNEEIYLMKIVKYQ